MCNSFHYSVGSLPIEVDKSIPDNIGSPNEPPPPLPPKANDDLLETFRFTLHVTCNSRLVLQVKFHR